MIENYTIRKTSNTGKVLPFEYYFLLFKYLILNPSTLEWKRSLPSLNLAQWVVVKEFSWCELEGQLMPPHTSHGSALVLLPVSSY